MYAGKWRNCHRLYFYTLNPLLLSLVQGDSKYTCVKNSPQETILRITTLWTFVLKVSYSHESYRLWASVVIVLEFHRVSGKIQYVFIFKWAYSKKFLIGYKTFWVGAVKNWKFSKFRIILSLNVTGSSRKIFCYLNINLGEQVSSRTFVIWTILKKVYLVKLYLNFVGSDSKILTKC